MSEEKNIKNKEGKENKPKIEKNKIEKNKNTAKKQEPKVDWKSKAQKLEKEIKLLKQQNINLEIENQKNLIEFQTLAKNFQSKAQKQIEDKIAEALEKHEEDKKHAKKYGVQKLVESIIEPILNIELAVQAGSKHEGVSAYVQGFEMLLGQLYQELEIFDIHAIVPKEGDVFNPEEHYAISQVEGGKTNTIKEIKKKGFKLHERVLKPATVITYK